MKVNVWTFQSLDLFVCFLGYVQVVLLFKKKEPKQNMKISYFPSFTENGTTDEQLPPFFTYAVWTMFKKYSG